MKASDVSLTALQSYADQDQAISMIENDHQNIVGGYRSWVSGYRTELTKTAEKKIAAIEKRQDRLFGSEED